MQSLGKDYIRLMSRYLAIYDKRWYALVCCVGGKILNQIQVEKSHRMMNASVLCYAESEKRLFQVLSK